MKPDYDIYINCTDITTNTAYKFNYKMLIKTQRNYDRRLRNGIGDPTGDYCSSLRRQSHCASMLRPTTNSQSTDSILFHEQPDRHRRQNTDATAFDRRISTTVRNSRTKLYKAHIFGF